MSRYRILAAVSLFCLCYYLASVCLRTLALYGRYPKPTRTYAPSGNDREPSFAIEFTIDRVLASVTLGNESTYGLAVVPGNNHYQSLMRHILETCH